MSLPCPGNRQPARKNPCKSILSKKEHLLTAALRYTRETIQTVHGNEACLTPINVTPARSKCGDYLEV
jgi:hypothetical protein